ncbi:MAG: glycosyltransferase family 4 protein [Nitrospirae bacterium]|nr:glycosyltransferase family 4 protein [Nitrospirota bacterium]
MKLGTPSVVVSTLGKFKLFQWAQALADRGWLEMLVTDYHRLKYGWLPSLRQDGEELPEDRIRCFLLPGLIGRAPQRISGHRVLFAERCASGLFDRWAAGQLGEGNLLVARSGAALHTIRSAHERGMKTVLYRGSTHILHQKQILEEERDRVGLPGASVAPWAVDRELNEYAESDHVYANSRFSMSTYLERGLPRDKLICFPPRIVVPPAIGRLNRKHRRLTVLFAGSIGVRKGVHDGIEAVRSIRSGQVRMVLAGPVEPEFRPLLRKYSGCYEHVGIVPPGEMGRLYREADVYLFPSIEEGFSSTLLEAMAFGLPVVATPNSGAEDVVRSGREGFVVPIRRPDILADRIETLLASPPLRGRMGRRARERATEFGLATLGSALAAVLGRIGFSTRLPPH